MKLTNIELQDVSGGSLSATLLNAIARITNTVYEIGRGVGSSLRRILTKSFC